MRLRRLCLAIFALRLFFKEPIQVFRIREPGFNHLIRRIATEFFASSTASGLGRSRWRRCLVSL